MYDIYIYIYVYIYIYITDKKKGKSMIKFLSESLNKYKYNQSIYIYIYICSHTYRFCSVYSDIHTYVCPHSRLEVIKGKLSAIPEPLHSTMKLPVEP